MAANFPLGVIALNHDELTGFDEFNLDEIKEMIGEETSCDPQAVQNVTTGNDPQIPVPAQNNADRKTAPQQKSALGKIVAMYLHDLVYLLIAVTIGLCLCFRMVIVDGHSMYDTLVNGDYLLLINNVFYHNPKPGDIIVASKDSFQDGSPIVKRVIAVEGQTVDIDFTTGTVYVDGVALVEPYIHTPTTNPEGMVFPLVVDEGCIFVMGDNRGRSMDSRDPEIGLIDKREVLGKAILIIWPGDDEGRLDRDFSRFGVIS
jgi:signal peptidase I